MNKWTYIAFGMIAIIGFGLWLVFSGGSIVQTPPTHACTQEAKICPDGVTAVGRTGPNCEFAACPTTTPTPTSSPTPAQTSPQEVTARIGQEASALGVSITPLEVTQDSRCPLDAECIWAGTVEVKARVETGMGTSVMTFTLGEPMTTEAQIVTLKDVTPSKSGYPIAPSSYRFVFEIVRR